MIRTAALMLSLAVILAATRLLAPVGGDAVQGFTIAHEIITSMAEKRAEVADAPAPIATDDYEERPLEIAGTVTDQSGRPLVGFIALTPWTEDHAAWNDLDGWSVDLVDGGFRMTIPPDGRARDVVLTMAGRTFVVEGVRAPVRRLRIRLPSVERVRLSGDVTQNLPEFASVVRAIGVLHRHDRRRSEERAAIRAIPASSHRIATEGIIPVSGVEVTFAEAVRIARLAGTSVPTEPAVRGPRAPVRIEATARDVDTDVTYPVWEAFPSRRPSLSFTTDAAEPAGEITAFVADASGRPLTGHVRVLPPLQNPGNFADSFGLVAAAEATFDDGRFSVSVPDERCNLGLTIAGKQYVIESVPAGTTDLQVRSGRVAARPGAGSGGRALGRRRRPGAGPGRPVRRLRPSRSGLRPRHRQPARRVLQPRRRRRHLHPQGERLRAVSHRRGCREGLAWRRARWIRRIRLSGRSGIGHPRSRPGRDRTATPLATRLPRTQGVGRRVRCDVLRLGPRSRL